VIQGVVSEDGTPLVTLSINNETRDGIIDTGFNGDLELPDELREKLNPVFVGRVLSALAGGQTVEEDIYLVEILFDGNMMHAEASFVAGTQILIGTRILQNYLLQIDFVRKAVQLSKVKQ